MTNPARSRSPSLPRSRSSNGSNARLEPPPVSRAPEDPEVAQSDSSEDEHFSDALEDGTTTSPTQPSHQSESQLQPSNHSTTASGPVPRSRSQSQSQSRSRSRSRSPAQPQSQSQSRSQSRPGSPYDNDTGRARSTTPVPRTRVERLDSEPSYGEAPGSPAYEKRRLDAVPDQVIVRSRSASQDGRAGDSTAQLSAPPRPPSSTSLASVPRTVVEKVDTATPSYGEDPTSPAYKARLADAAPDYIFQSDGQSHVSEVLTQEPESTGEGPTTAPIAVPETRVSRVDTLPTREKTRILHKRNPSDAEPDVVETASQTDSGRLTNADSPSPSRSGTADAQPTFGQLTMPPPPPPAPSADESEEYDSEEDDNTEEPADAEGSGAAVVNSPPVPQSTVEVSQNVQQTPPENPAPIFVDFDQLDSLSDLIDIWQPDLDTLFPQSKDVESYPPVPPIPDSSTIFITDRSRSLWSQLIVPPPLQPPNWARSRIRRLFLISLGVPVDLDQILPAKKQKKLVLYSKNFNTATNDYDRRRHDGTATPGTGASTRHGTPSTSRPGSRPRDAQTTTSSSRRRGPPPPPDLDFTWVRQLYAMTNEALSGLTDAELRQHILDLEEVTVTASKVLEYWLQRKDRQVGEKEAFEGVIENLVKHARQVRQ